MSGYIKTNSNGAKYGDNTDLVAIQTPITRKEAAKLVMSGLMYLQEISSIEAGYEYFPDLEERVLGIQKERFEGLFSTESDIFNSDDFLHRYRYYEPCAFAVQYGVMSGYTDGTFKPNGNITRAEAASTLARLVYKDLRLPKGWECAAVGDDYHIFVY